MVPGGGGTVATPTTEEEKTTPSSHASEQQPPPVPPETGPPSLAADSQEGKPWALKLGEYLQRRSKGEVTEPDADAVPWAVQLGTYLREKQPGPWSLLANEKPQDPLVRCRSGAWLCRRSGEPSAHPCPQALRLGNFINETQPIKVFHQGSDDASGEQPKEPKDPLVLRLGNYLSGSKEAPTSAEPPPVEPPPPSAAAKEAVPVPAAAPAPPVVPPPATSEPAAATPPAIA